MDICIVNGVIHDYAFLSDWRDTNCYAGTAPRTSSLIDQTGGSQWSSRSGALESALAQPQWRLRPSTGILTMAEKAAALAFRVIDFHPICLLTAISASGWQRYLLCASMVRIYPPTDDQERVVLRSTRNESRRAGHVKVQKTHQRMETMTQHLWDVNLNAVDGAVTDAAC